MVYDDESTAVLIDMNRSRIYPSGSGHTARGHTEGGYSLTVVPDGAPVVLIDDDARANGKAPQWHTPRTNRPITAIVSGAAF